jgi:hypothetical protein
MKMHSPAPAVIVNSDLVSAVVIVKMTPAERRFVEKQARLELRTISNFVRSLIIEKMSG